MKPSNDKTVKKIEKEFSSFQDRDSQQNRAIEQAFFGDKNGKAVIDEAYCWVAFNKAYAREFYLFFGVRPSLGTSLKDTTPKDKESFEKMLQDLGRAMEGKLKTHRSIRQTPSPGAVTVHFQPILLDDERKAVSVSFSNPESGDTLLNAAHKFQDFADLANLMPHMVWIADAQGRIQFINKFWESFTGETDESLLVEAYSKSVHDDDRSQVWARWGKAIEEQTPYEAELRLKNRQGEYRWFVSRASPVKDRQGNVLRWVGISMDVHDYKEMAQTLKQQQGFLRALADNVPAFILSLDEQGHIRFANSFHKKMGFDPDTLVGQTFYTAYTLKDASYAKALHQAIEKALEGDEERIQGRLYVTNGETIEVETIVYPYKSDFLQPKGVILLSFDVTRHKKAQDNLQSQKNHLQEVNQDFDLLFHRMAHDIYGPLSSLEGLFQLLFADAELSKKQKPLLKHVESSLKKFRSTLEHITSWVAASANNASSLEQTRLEDLMTELLWDMQETITLTNTTVDIVYERHYFGMSSRNLRSILYNIISNAIKYSKKSIPPHVKITFFENKAYECCIEVQDNGIGIETGELNKVTEAFTKIDQKSGGLGLGMYVVKRVVERYQGTIEIESTKGEGTLLRIFLCPR